VQDYQFSEVISYQCFIVVIYSFQTYRQSTLVVWGLLKFWLKYV